MHIVVDLLLAKALGRDRAPGLAGAPVIDASQEVYAEFLADLRPYVCTVDGPPPEYYELMVGAWSFRDPDAALAALLEDSALAGFNSGVRAGTATHTLLFDLGDDVTLDVEILADRVVGDVDGASVQRAWCQTGSDEQAVPVEDGTFLQISPVPSGPFCIVLELEQRRIVTDWLLA